jgi:ABC-2 type transport system permease protein
MTEHTATPTTSIYDLGYQPYDGPRLGRRYAVTSLFFYSLRAVFGIGRPLLSKAFPMGLAILALIPALVQLAIAAIAPLDLEFVRPEEYFSFVLIVLALFCAVVAPEIVGRDQRNRTLPLYFSRALSRADYVTAKWTALVVGLAGVLALPQLILLAGNAVATEDLVGYLGDNLDLLAPILAGSLTVAVVMSSISLAIASQTSKRAIATGAVVAYFVIFTALGSILVETTTGDVQRYVVLLSPANVLDGSVYWFFDAPPPFDSDLEKAGRPGYVYFLAAIGYTAVSLGGLYRRYLRLAV